MTDNDDLRTALTKLAVPMYYDATPGAYPVTAVPMSHLLSALAAHPAPEESPFAPDAVASRLTKSATQGPAPVSDTRREDAVREIERAIRQSFESDDHAHTYRRAALAVLAVLPAPPVEDEVPAGAPPYLVGIPEDMSNEPMSGDDWVEYGFDAGVLWGAWNARRGMPEVAEAEIRDLAREARHRLHEENEFFSWSDQSDAHDTGYVAGYEAAIARLRGATR